MLRAELQIVLSKGRGSRGDLLGDHCNNSDRNAVTKVIYYLPDYMEVLVDIWRASSGPCRSPKL